MRRCVNPPTLQAIEREPAHRLLPSCIVPHSVGSLRARRSLPHSTQNKTESSLAIVSYGARSPLTINTLNIVTPETKRFAACVFLPRPVWRLRWVNSLWIVGCRERDPTAHTRPGAKRRRCGKWSRLSIKSTRLEYRDSKLLAVAAQVTQVTVVFPTQT